MIKFFLIFENFFTIFAWNSFCTIQQTKLNSNSQVLDYQSTDMTDRTSKPYCSRNKQADRSYD